MNVTIENVIVHMWFYQLADNKEYMLCMLVTESIISIIIVSIKAEHISIVNIYYYSHM